MGAGTPFEGMSHEAMLAWLDQASSGTVRGAADRLAAAAKEIRTIAADLKVRPQWVEWKGAGADAFRTWSADLANATLRLSDFSEGSATWLGHASNAIASAQASIPRDAGRAQANLDAARSAHNDPDASVIARKSASELAALEADKEKVRQEAVAQMRKLGQAYEQAATQMNGLERPKFPPPPQAIAPDQDLSRHRSAVDLPSEGTGHGTSVPGHAGSARPAHAETEASATASHGPHQTGSISAEQPLLRDGPQPARMDVDSVASLAPTVHAPGPAGSVPGPIGGHEASAVRMSPPAFGGGLSVPSASGGPERPSVAARPGGISPNPTGRNSERMPNGASGITGGRPVPAPQERPSRGIPKGTVVGSGEAGSHGMTRPPVAGVGPAGQATGRPGVPTGRGSSAPRSGVSGGSAQQPERAAGARSVSPGAAAERGGVSGGRPVVGNAGGGAHAGGQPPRAAQKGRSRREDGGRGPGYLVEDEETWLREDPRVVPPVIE